MSLGLVIAAFNTGTYTVTRTGADSYTDGVRTVGSTSTFSIDASIQPMSGRDLKAALAEGRRAEDVRTVWTKTAALVADPNPDKIAIGTETWEVFRVFGFSILDPTFYRVGIAKQGTP